MFIVLKKRPKLKAVALYYNASSSIYREFSGKKHQIQKCKVLLVIPSAVFHFGIMLNRVMNSQPFGLLNIKKAQFHKE